MAAATCSLGAVAAPALAHDDVLTAKDCSEALAGKGGKSDNELDPSVLRGQVNVDVTAAAFSDPPQIVRVAPNIVGVGVTYSFLTSVGVSDDGTPIFVTRVIADVGYCALPPGSRGNKLRAIQDQVGSIPDVPPAPSRR